MVPVQCVLHISVHESVYMLHRHPMIGGSADECVSATYIEEDLLGFILKPPKRVQVVVRRLSDYDRSRGCCW